LDSLGSGSESTECDFSYTANWPADRLIGNQAPGQFIIWSIVSIIILIAGIGVFCLFI